MGGAVSSGRDNNELIDNLMGGNYIRTRSVERVFRALDRADYMTPEARDQAYKDLAWRNGPLHMSAPCIYSEVMEGLELRPGLSFLNVGSGTGYLSTLVGLILGSGGISHGIEVHPVVVEYATKKMSQFLENSPILDDFDFCEPKFYCGNGLCLAPLQSPYDRVYCGAGCPEEYQNYFKQLIKVGGLLVMPLNDNLVQVRRVGETEWVSRSLLNVSFATLRVPSKDEAADLIKLDEQTPPRLQLLSRGVIRGAMRAGLLRRHPELREPPQRPPPAKNCPRRICIPVRRHDSDVEGLDALHDLDEDGGAREMNALLSMVLSMGQNRVAGALRFDSLDSPVDSDSDDDDDDDAPAAGGGGEAGAGEGGDNGGGETVSSNDASPSAAERSRRTDSSGDDADRSNRTDTDRASRGDTDRTSRNDSDRTNRGNSSRGSLFSFEFLDTIAAIAAQRSAARRDGDPAPPADPASAPAPAPPRPAPEDSTEGDEPTNSNEPRRTRDRGEMDDRGQKKDDNSRSVSSPAPRVPAEVEIYLGARAGPSGDAHVRWGADSSDDSDDDAKGKDKRQKLDSGIGEETTPTTDSSPVKSDTRTDESDADAERPDDSLTDDVDDDHLSTRRRLQKRGRGLGARSTSSTECSDSSESGGRRAKRRARSRPPGTDARRVRLSVLMKRGVKELPLPHALKKYVNLGRCFEF